MNDDERIAAWLDGTMPEAEAARFEAELDSNPALAEQLASWQKNDDLLRAAYNAPIDQGVDDALLARMGLAEPAVAAKPVPIAANDNPAWRRWAIPLGGALAASIALAVLLTGNPMSGGPKNGSEAQLAQAMDQLPSRGETALSDGGKVSPVLSFAAADGRFCREFTVTGGAQSGGGIACKDASGWKIEARTGSGAQSVDPGKIGTASGQDGGGLDSAYARLGASDPLTADAEARLIASGWKTSR
jgi:negative regulator of sigma E activity